MELDNDQYQPTGFEQVTCTPNGGTPRDLVIGGVKDPVTEDDLVLTNNRIALESIVTADLINPANTIECSGTISVQYIGDAEGNGGGDSDGGDDGGCEAAVAAACVGGTSDVQINARIHQFDVDDIQDRLIAALENKFDLPENLNFEVQCSQNGNKGNYKDDCEATARNLPALDACKLKADIQASYDDNSFIQSVYQSIYTYRLEVSSTDVTCPSEGNSDGGGDGNESTDDSYFIVELYAEVRSQIYNVKRPFNEGSKEALAGYPHAPGETDCNYLSLYDREPNIYHWECTTRVSFPTAFPTAEDVENLQTRIDDGSVSNIIEARFDHEHFYMYNTKITATQHQIGRRKLEATGSKKQQRGSKTIHFSTETRGLQDLAEEGVFSLDITVVSGAAAAACSGLLWSLVSIGVLVFLV